MTEKERLRHAGRELFMLGLPNVEIARILDVTPTTVSAWVTKGAWHEERATKGSVKKTIQDNLLALIDYQLEALNAQVSKNRASNTLTLLDKGEIDALAKMFATVKGKELTWATYVNVIRELNEFTAAKALDLAKAMIPYTDEFLNAKREALGA